MIYDFHQLSEEKKKNLERDADLPPVAGGSLGSFRDGLQTLPLRVSETQIIMSMYYNNEEQ